jgi:hypothetical protein
LEIRYEPAMDIRQWKVACNSGDIARVAQDSALVIHAVVRLINGNEKNNIVITNRLEECHTLSFGTIDLSIPSVLANRDMRIVELMYEIEQNNTRVLKEQRREMQQEIASLKREMRRAIEHAHGNLAHAQAENVRIRHENDLEKQRVQEDNTSSLRKIERCLAKQSVENKKMHMQMTGWVQELSKCSAFRSGTGSRRLVEAESLIDVYQPLSDNRSKDDVFVCHFEGCAGTKTFKNRRSLATHRNRYHRKSLDESFDT